MPLPHKTLKFNVAGPCNPDEHYMLPPLGRIPGLLQLVEEGNYFVLHAPRQSGKTTAIQALVEAINGTGGMRALYFSLEATQAFTDPASGMDRLSGNMVSDLLDHPLFGSVVAPFDPQQGNRPPRLKRLLTLLAQAAGKPLAVFSTKWTLWPMEPSSRSSGNSGTGTSPAGRFPSPSPSRW